MKAAAAARLTHVVPPLPAAATGENGATAMPAFDRPYIGTCARFDTVDYGGVTPGRSRTAAT